MSDEILKLKPEAVWKNFYSLTQIPRPSKKEAKVIEFMKKFGEDLGLETIVDGVGNVIIKKPATPGMENKKTICLQGHLDMVPQKNSNVDHDFEKDPIDAYVDGEWVTARDTTLGADNGIGVAAAMAVLESKDIKHGPIEALFTIDEETGMTGAFGLKPDVLNADILLNLDSEDEGELYIGCAGGENTNMEFTYSEEDVPAGSAAYEVKVTGMKGGHSGLDINIGRGNAIKVLNRFLYNAAKDFDLRIASIEGGSLRNAIPREGFAIATVPADKKGDFEKAASEYEKTIKSELGGTEPDMAFKVTETDMPSKLIDKKTQDALLRAIYATPNGVIRMSDSVEGLVETSTNLASVKSENGKIFLQSLQRSSVDSAREDICAAVRCVYELAGAQVEHNGAYPGWKPNMDSPILKKMLSVYKDNFGKTPEVKAIHAGLECGLLGAVYPKTDMISFGPTIRFPHSPDEKVNIATVQKFWDFLVKTLEQVDDK
ncbi:cytosol nonspecific dipeptidase [candidate division KSB1 bacterium]|nr:MAG: cytosol nonspecific dipeptidase [candidate division KSB1 bacterium]